MARNITNMQVVIGANASGLKRELQNTKKEISGLEGAVQGALGAFASYDIGSRLISGLKQATDSAIKFESAMADVKKVVDFDAPAQFKEMEKDIIALSQRIPMAADGLSKIVAAGGQANIPREELVKFAETAAKMGVAFDIAADEAGSMMANWRTAFGYGQEEVTALADQINYLGNTTSAGTGPISEVVTRIGALGGVSGVSSANIAALAASVAGTGQPAEIAATGIKNLMLALTKGSAATKSQEEAFQALGLSATSVAQKMQVDAEGAILEVLGAISKLDSASQAATLTKLFGSESVSAIAPLLTQLDTLKENFNKVGSASQYAGSMEKEFEARIQTTEAQLQLLKNSIESVAIELGSVFLPAITEMAKSAASVANSFASWSGENKELIESTTKVVAGIVALKTATMGLQTVVSAVPSVYQAILSKVSQSAATQIAEENKVTANYQKQVAQRMALLQKQSLAEQKQITQKVLKQKLASDETVAIISAECAKIEARYTALGAKMRSEMKKTYESNIVEAQRATVAQVAGCSQVGTAVKGLTSAVWALAGGWYGVAAAVAYATYKLIDYYKVKAQETKDNTYEYEGKTYQYDPDNNKWYTNTTSQKMDSIASSGGAQSGAANAMLSLHGWTGKKNEVSDYVKIDDLENLRYERENKAEIEAQKMRDSLNQSAPPTIDIPAIPAVGGGGGDVSGGGGSSSKVKEDDYTRKLAQAQEKASSLFDEMQEKISSSTSTSLSDMLRQNAKELAKKSKDIEEIASAGVEPEKVDMLRSQLEEYGNTINTEVRDKWREAYEDMVSESRTASAETLKDYKALAEAEYQATLTRLDRERVAKEKELMEDKDDYETRDKIAELYEAKRLQALEEYNEALRDSQSKRISSLVDKGDITSLREIITILNSDEGIANMESSLRREGIQKYADTYVSIWKEAHRDVSEYLADASESVYSTLTDSLTEFVQGTKSAKSAFNDLGNNILNMIAKIAAQKLASTLVTSLMSSISFSGGGLVYAATGGYISGSGTSTSDSIPAMLSNGEYVIKASSVKAIGVNTLDRLNQAGTLKAFSNGGYVSGISSLNAPGSFGGIGKAQSQAPQVVVNITNNSNAEASVENSNFNSDLNRMVLDIVIDGASRNVGGFGSNLKSALG